MQAHLPPERSQQHHAPYGRQLSSEAPASFAYLAGEVHNYSKGYPSYNSISECDPDVPGLAFGNGQSSSMADRSNASIRRNSNETNEVTNEEEDGADGQSNKKPKLTRIQQACENCGAKKQKSALIDVGALVRY